MQDLTPGHSPRTQLPNAWTSELLTKIEAERRQVLPEGQLAERARWRDNRLMALVAHQRHQPD